MVMAEIFSEEIEQVSLKLVEINARLVILNPTNPDYEIYKETPYKYLPKEIIGLNVDGYKIEINDILKYKKNKYNIQSIKKGVEYGDGYYLYTHELSKSYHFIMPVLGSKATNFRVQMEFCNCYIGTEDDGDYGDYVYLLYRFNGDKEFIKFEQLLMSHPMYIETVKTDQYHIMYKFRIDPRYKEDINLIVNGKYSYIDPKYKERILFFHGQNDALNDILSRSEARRKELEKKYDVDISKDLDLLSIPDPDKEMYLNKYRIPVETNNFEI